MGYCIQMRDANFFISKHDKEKALAAIKKLADVVKEKGSKFDWVKTQDFINAENLTDAMRAWRWEVEENDKGDIHYIGFKGQNLGDDEVLFNAIAPYVIRGSFIEMTGDDNAIWRWKFKDNKVEQLDAKITFEDVH